MKISQVLWERGITYKDVATVLDAQLPLIGYNKLRGIESSLLKVAKAAGCEVVLRFADSEYVINGKYEYPPNYHPEVIILDDDIIVEEDIIIET